jgi:hypothetical protein
MNPTLALAHQPVPVLVALFNQIATKTLNDGKTPKPICVKIYKILAKRGYDVEKLTFE